MVIYLLRHGIAVERHTGGTANDADRPLTDQGRNRMRREAAGMRRLGLEIDLVFTSPLVRARQTAEVVAEAYGLDDSTVVIGALAPGAGFVDALNAQAPIVRELGAREFQSAMLVGHEPDLSELASLVLTGALDLNVQFKKGALCAIQIGDLSRHDTNTLLWLLAPRQLRALADPAL